MSGALPAEKDSLFDQALPGNLIVIQGSGFSGLQAVYFNDSIAAFNPVYVTNNNIIINIPSGAKTAATIRRVQFRSHRHQPWIVITTFHIVLNAPVITGITIDSTGGIADHHRRQPGGRAVLLLFTWRRRIRLLSWSIPNQQLMWPVIPAGAPTADSVRVYCTFGVASFAYPPPATILSISNENATAGTTIVINGHNFIGITQVLFPGGIQGTNLVTNSVNQLTVTVPAGITTTDSLRLKGASSGVGGQLFDSYLSPFTPGYISDFSTQSGTGYTGFVNWTGAYAASAAAATSYPGATNGVGVLKQGGILGANAGPTSEANPGDLQLNDNPWVSNTGAAIAGYSLKFEIYVANAWKGGEIWIAVGDWYDWSSFTARYAPWQGAPGGVYQPTGWQTVTIPLTQFIGGNQFWQTSWNPAGAPAVHFSDYPYTSVCFMLTNDQASSVPVANGVNVAIDNVRVVYGQ